MLWEYKKVVTGEETHSAQICRIAWMSFKAHLPHCSIYISFYSERCRATLQVPCISGQRLSLSPSSKLCLKSCSCLFFWQTYELWFSLLADVLQACFPDWWVSSWVLKLCSKLSVIATTWADAHNSWKSSSEQLQFLVLGVEFAQWLQDEHQSKTGMDKTGCLLLPPPSVSHALCVLFFFLSHGKA